jgi:starvation-inducible DNA-binding protein
MRRVARRMHSYSHPEEAMQINIGIDQQQREEIAGALSRVLSDTYTLYLKTHNFHWNVTGPMFQTLHLKFEEQYNELWMAVDTIAERIRALGVFAPGTSRQLAALSSIKENETVPDAKGMIRALLEGHEMAAKNARDAFKLAEKNCDQPTCDLLTGRMQIHEKEAWMLRSLLE